MEVLAGPPSLEAEVSQHGARFRLNFAEVREAAGAGWYRQDRRGPHVKKPGARSLLQLAVCMKGDSCVRMMQQTTWHMSAGMRLCALYACHKSSCGPRPLVARVHATEPCAT